ncbi:MAG: hypothetical protein ACLFPV_15605, partial [Spirochaetaceae bacterium]
PGTIPPGESRDTPLRLILNTDLFEVEEDLPIQASMSVRATAGSTQHSTERSQAFTLHRRTALNWIETECLGAFITPNESIISRFGRAEEALKSFEAALTPAAGGKPSAMSISSTAGHRPLRGVTRLPAGTTEPGPPAVLTRLPQRFP